jgi:exonuclease VII large subunit
VEVQVAGFARRVAGAAATRAEAAAVALSWSTTRLAAAERVLERADAELRTMAATLDGRDPAQVLARGWTLTTDGSGRIVRHPDGLSRGDQLTTRFAAGVVQSTVDAVSLDTRSAAPAGESRPSAPGAVGHLPSDVNREQESP